MSKKIFGQKWIISWKKWCKKVMEQECQDMVHDVIFLFISLLAIRHDLFFPQQSDMRLSKAQLNYNLNTSSP